MRANYFAAAARVLGVSVEALATLALLRTRVLEDREYGNDGWGHYCCGHEHELSKQHGQELVDAGLVRFEKWMDYVYLELAGQRLHLECENLPETERPDLATLIDCVPDNCLTEQLNKAGEHAFEYTVQIKGWAKAVAGTVRLLEPVSSTQTVGLAKDRIGRSLGVSPSQFRVLKLSRQAA